MIRLLVDQFYIELTRNCKISWHDSRYSDVLTDLLCDISTGLELSGSIGPSGCSKTSIHLSVCTGFLDSQMLD